MKTRTEPTNEKMFNFTHMLNDFPNKGPYMLIIHFMKAPIDPQASYFCQPENEIIRDGKIFCFDPRRGVVDFNRNRPTILPQRWIILKAAMQGAHRLLRRRPTEEREKGSFHQSFWSMGRARALDSFQSLITAHKVDLSRLPHSGLPISPAMQFAVF